MRVAVVGSGPSGVYAAEALVGQDAVPVEVDVLDRLPTPYGLVRYGVAPDHPKIKSIIETLRRVLEHPRVRFLGGVEVGGGDEGGGSTSGSAGGSGPLSHRDLAAQYDAVVYAVGASADRRLEIPGEDLPGSFSAVEFVSWYNGHPDAVPSFRLDAEAAVVVGAGNVALDVARMLAKNDRELSGTDLTPSVRDTLRGSRIRDVHMIARRGPQDAKFTTRELRELGGLEDAEVLLDPAELKGEPAEAVAAADRRVRGNLEVLTGWSRAAPRDTDRRIRPRFRLRPVEILGIGRVEAVRVERMRDDSTGLIPTGRFETIPAQLVLRAVGYRGVPLPGLPFDGRRGVIPNIDGRVIGGDGEPMPGTYVVGWIKRGPTGVIGTNRADAVETVRAVLADLASPADQATRAAAGSRTGDGVDTLLRSSGITPITYEGWLAIDAGEVALGVQNGRSRTKIDRWDVLRSLGTGPTTGA